MTALHFIRPFWFLAFIPLGLLAWALLKQQPHMLSWQAVCDKHLLMHLLRGRGQDWRSRALLLLFASAFLMVLSLTGPSWQQLAVPTYAHALPRVVVLDMSDAMLERDIRPNRLTRAKFKLHDLFSKKDVGQFGLVVYTDEAFVVSPLTQDGETIDALLSSLSPEIMPVDGQRLDLALDEGVGLIRQAGFNHGQLLVLTATQPSNAAIKKAELLAKEGFYLSIMPMRRDGVPDVMFQRFAKAGHGQLLMFSDTSADLDHWLSATEDNGDYISQNKQDLPLWRDEGRWFLLLALCLLLPVFRRGWLQRIQA